MSYGNYNEENGINIEDWVNILQENWKFSLLFDNSQCMYFYHIHVKSTKYPFLQMHKIIIMHKSELLGKGGGRIYKGRLYCECIKKNYNKKRNRKRKRVCPWEYTT